MIATHSSSRRTKTYSYTEYENTTGKNILLQEKAQHREHALYKAEHMLQEDADRFEQFLQDNDAKCAEAMKKHDVEAKAKQEKAQHLKRMNQEIGKIKTEIDKYFEALSECMKYK